MSKDNVLAAIKHVAENEIPQGATIYLFGSRARGDERTDSDWDILVVLDKEQLAADDHDCYAYPFWELGWKIDQMIHPAIYTRKDWETKSNPIFRENVKRDSIRIC